MSDKPMPRPAAWKNTYFWIALILLVVGIVGIVGGQAAIRDPGQRDENGLVWIYFGASIVMLINGLLSHKQTVAQYEIEQEARELHEVPSDAATSS